MGMFSCVRSNHELSKTSMIFSARLTSSVPVRPMSSRVEKNTVAVLC